MLASAMRFAAYGSQAAAIPALTVADLCLFLAFLIAAHRMIEHTGGRTGLGHLTFRQQFSVGHRVLYRVLLLLGLAALALFAVGARELAPYMLMGFDGIAFDQFSRVGMIWSSILRPSCC